MRRLPPLNSLKTFEAAARLGGVVPAANELCVSHGAVSKQLANLESWMGVALFDRSARRLGLTAAGRGLLEAVSPALDQVAEAIGRIAPLPLPEAAQLVVSAPPTLTLHWLVPRLTSFLRLHPEIGIRLNNRREQNGVWPPGVDVVIRRGANRHPQRHGLPFMQESVTPMCAPSIATRFKGVTLCERGGALSGEALSVLAGQTWLTADMRPDDWGHWQTYARASSLIPSATVSFDHTYLALEAALDGLGVAMAPRVLMEEELASGRLVAPFAHALAPSEPYVIVYEHHREGDAAIAAFSAWLLGQASMHEARVAGSEAMNEFS
ncbi:transcriptional regulator [Pigmentiphaga litoralis]|uniref:LysR substrate-binding domain-containing protein n=1 Tax=Pigmentiphaga litoralis TaxID=516702 RepID=UPI00167B5FDA|nr:LysR substrate-binding domain-containing protein [Pigmentiphaga litoralis]GGX06432.1 transcriptional regulator [Pigmentiphaga litoralis]